MAGCQVAGSDVAGVKCQRAGIRFATRSWRYDIRNYANLIAWQKGMLPSNITEGEGRGRDGQLLHALSVSYGSLRELET